MKIYLYIFALFNEHNYFIYLFFFYKNKTFKEAYLQILQILDEIYENLQNIRNFLTNKQKGDLINFKAFTLKFS